VQAPPDVQIDHRRVQLGLGIEAFERAKIALRQWKMFAMPWVHLCCSDAPIRVGHKCRNSDFAFRVLVAQRARIVYVLEDSGCERYGFAYGTLLEHGERGEERFKVEFHTRDGTVWYDLFAFSRPGTAARFAYPLARSLQKRFRVDSQCAMQDTVKIL